MALSSTETTLPSLMSLPSKAHSDTATATRSQARMVTKGMTEPDGLRPDVLYAAKKLELSGAHVNGRIWKILSAKGISLGSGEQ